MLVDGNVYENFSLFIWHFLHQIEDGGEDDGVQAALEADIGQMHSSLEHGEEPR